MRRPCSVVVMRIGFIGAGNMASALARGLGEPVVCSDVDAARAQALAAELGGAGRRDERRGGRARATSSCCATSRRSSSRSPAGSTPATRSSCRCSEAWRSRPSAPPTRAPASTGSCPTPPSRSAAASIGLVDDDAGDPQAFAAVQELLAPRRRGHRAARGPARPAHRPSPGSGPPTPRSSPRRRSTPPCAPGIPAPVAARLVGASMAGGAALLQARDMDTLGVRRAVTSPGGVTARGLAALEAGGIRARVRRRDGRRARGRRMSVAVLVVATARSQIADYVSTLISVYVVLILVYILSTLFFSFGGRAPYNRALERRARVPAPGVRALPAVLPARSSRRSARWT